MAADFNLTNQYISQSFENLVQDSGSIPVDGLGNQITNLTVTASKATNADTASFFGDGIVTASAVSSTITFTKDNGTTFDLTVAQSGSVDSASYAAFAEDANSASYAVTASHLTGVVTSASYATFAQNADEANDLVITVKNVSGGTLAIGTAVHPVGVTGENIEVVTASADQAGNMPAVAVLSQEISNNGSGTAIINGRLTGINTANLVAGAPVYVNNGGLFTATKPTGSALIQNIGTAAKINASDGEIILQGSGRSNDVPNISTGYLWVGNNDQVATPTLSSSIVVDNANTASYVAGANVDGTVASATSASHAIRADIADDLDSSARINITDITASNASFTSASIGFLQSITGSAKIIGDAFIILNNDTPTERYAGVKVYDSGSSNNTSSLQYDGLTDDWFFEKDVLGSTEYGVSLFGPEYSTKGTPTYNTNNTLPKGTGGHHLNDSSIVDDGTNVTTNLPISASGGITGSLFGTASYAENANVDSGSWDGIFTGSASITSSLTVDGAFRNNIKEQPGSSNQFDILTAPSFTKSVNPGSGSTVVYNSISYANWGGGKENVWLVEQGNAAFNVYAQQAVGIGRITNALAAGSGQTLAAMDLVNVNEISQSATEVRNYGSYMALGEYNGKQIQIGNSNRNVADLRANQNIAIMGQDIFLGGTQDTSYTFRESTVNFDGNTPTKDIKLDYTGSVYLRQSGSIAGTPALIVTGSVTATSFTGSLLGSDIVVSGSVVSEISALSIASNTASMDCSLGDMFTLTLVSGSNTHLDATNIQRGQTISLKVLQPSTATDSYGTMTFDSEFAFAGGTAPTITAASGSTDILTFQSYDATTLFGTAVQNLS